MPGGISRETEEDKTIQKIIICHFPISNKQDILIKSELQGKWEVDFRPMLAVFLCYSTLVSYLT